MPTNLTDVDAFTSPVAIPTDGDTRNAASVLPAFQALADRTRYLNNLVNPSGVARTIVLSPMALANANGGWGPDALGSLTNAEALTAGGKLTLDLGRLLPTGCQTTSIEAMVTPKVARVGTARMLGKITAQTPTWGGTPSAPAETTLVETYDDGGVGIQKLQSTLIRVITEGEILLYTLRAGIATIGDYAWAVRVNFLDYGARSY